MHDDLQDARSKAGEIASSIVGGSVRPLLAPRMLISYLTLLRNEIDQEIYRFIQGVDSETDALPIGPERQYWAAEALGAKDRQADEYETRVREKILEAAEYLVARYRGQRTGLP